MELSIQDVCRTWVKGPCGRPQASILFIIPVWFVDVLYE